MSTADPGAAQRRRRGVFAAALAILALPLFPGSAPAQVGGGKVVESCLSEPPETRDACLAGRKTAADSLQTVAILPAARLGASYNQQVVSGGEPPYTLDPGSVLPPDLKLTTTGQLVGRPTRLGRNVIILVARDRGQHVTRGHYTLRVYLPAPIRPPARKPPIAPSQPVVTPVPVVLPQPAAPLGQIALWSLSQGDLVALANPPPPAAEPEPPPPPPPPPDSPAGPANPRPPAPGERSPPVVDMTPSEPPFALSPVQQQRLQPIVNLEYPTLALFKAAVHARLDPFRPRAGMVAERAPLPEPVIDIIARQAFKPQSYYRAPRARLGDDPGCGCVQPPPTPNIRRTVGFVPFWRPTAEGQRVQFSLFDRLEVVGAQLQSDFSWLTPGGPAQEDAWAQDMNRLAIAAHRHGVGLDLVLHGADWRFLPRDGGDEALAKMAKAAAAGALRRANAAKLSGAEPFFSRFLVDVIWRTRPHRVFDGVTVMFEPPPPGSPNSAVFERFLKLFVNELVAQANARGEPFAVNIVAPYDPDVGARGTLFRPGPFSMVNMLDYLHKQSDKQTPPLADEERVHYSRTSVVQVRLLVLMPSPTTDSKKALRAEVDRAETYQTLPHSIRGPNRVSLTNWMIPVLFDPSGPTPAPGQPAGKAPPSLNAGFSVAEGGAGLPGEPDDFPMDLFYLRENFGGFGAWPVPVEGVDAGTFANREIVRVFFPDRQTAFLGVHILPICSLLLRLIWQLLVVLVPVGLVVANFADLPQARRRQVLLATGLCALAAGVLGFLLLQVDPALDQIKRGNKPFQVTLLALAAGAIWHFVRPRIRRP